MTNPAERLLADIRELATGITSRAAEIEAGRRMPADLVEALRSIGIFRMFVPQSHGGLELDQGHGRLGGEFLRSRGRRTVCAGTALSSRAATPSADAWRQLRWYSRGRLGRTGRACQYRPA